MKSTKQFLTEKPSRRTDMIQRGYEHLSCKMKLLTVELRVLNAWVQLMPGLLAEEGATFPDDDFTDVLEHYAHDLDEMSNKIMENSELLLEMDKAIKFYTKYGYNDSL